MLTSRFMRSLASHLLFCCAAVLPMRGQETQDPAQLVARLTDTDRATVHQQLVALGNKAVPALIDALGTEDRTVLIEVVSILRKIGADAADAVEGLKRALGHADEECAAEILWTLGELGPYRAASVNLDPLDLLRVLFRHLPRLAPGKIALPLKRLRTRVEFPVDVELSALIATARGLHAWRVELAVDLLGHRGSAARTAIPALLEVLDRPDPRILRTEGTVPLRAKAARAILAITSHGPAAEQAHAVLAGQTAAPAANRAPPERARARIAELIRELQDRSRFEAVVANLTAYGAMAAPALVEAIQTEEGPEFREAALMVLRKLGPRAVEAVPQLVDLLPRLPIGHTLSLLRTLTSIAPWSRDVVPSLGYSTSIGRLSIWGHRILGKVDAAFLTEFGEAAGMYYASMAVDPSCTLPELENKIGSDNVQERQVALTVLVRRGAEARPLLPALAAALDQQQPKNDIVVWGASGIRHESHDRTEIVHRLAAEAILAIGAADDPLVGKAKQVLAGSAGK